MYLLNAVIYGYLQKSPDSFTFCVKTLRVTMHTCATEKCSQIAFFLVFAFLTCSYFCAFLNIGDSKGGCRKNEKIGII